MEPIKLNAPPSFKPYFDVNTALPGERNKDFGGYVLNLPEAKYREWPGLNSSLLKERTACEMLFELRKPRENDFETKSRAEAFTLGTLLHWAALEPWKFDAEHKDKHMLLCETKGLDTLKAQDQRKNNPGKLLVTSEFVDVARRCLDAVQANARAVELLTDKRLVNPSKEASGFVFDTEMMIWRKWRVDFMAQNADYMVDVKTSRRHPSEFEKDCWEFGYFNQAAWYMDSHFRLTGKPIRNFYWIVVSKNEPFMSRVEFMQNIPPDNPLYQDPKCKLAMARTRLGLDPQTMKIGRFQTFIDCAGQTEQYRDRGIPLTEKLLRRTWPAYEQEAPEHEIF